MRIKAKKRKKKKHERERESNMYTFKGERERERVAEVQQLKGGEYLVKWQWWLKTKTFETLKL